jgi:hypothetical protein
MQKAPSPKTRGQAAEGSRTAPCSAMLASRKSCFRCRADQPSAAISKKNALEARWRPSIPFRLCWGWGRQRAKLPPTAYANGISSRSLGAGWTNGEGCGVSPRTAFEAAASRNCLHWRARSRLGSSSCTVGPHSCRKAYQSPPIVARCDRRKFPASPIERRLRKRRAIGERAGSATSCHPFARELQPRAFQREIGLHPR